MSIEIVFETHSLTQDNEHGIATGWLPGRLSTRGCALASELGERRRDDGISTVFTSDLARALETASLAFDATAIPVLHDWRLRECDYGNANGMPAAELHQNRADYLDRPHPAGESWRQAVHTAGKYSNATAHRLPSPHTNARPDQRGEHPTLGLPIVRDEELRLVDQARLWELRSPRPPRAGALTRAGRSVRASRRARGNAPDRVRLARRAANANADSKVPGQSAH